jgi:flagellar motor component MotA
VISLVNKGYHFAKLVAEAVRLLLIVLFVAMALEQLEVAPGIVVSAFSIIFGGIVLALAIAFGVGGIDAAKKIIEKETVKTEKGDEDIEHI